jgi:non-specific serine/threonine protein kinase
LREEAGRSALETLVSQLQGKRMLLLLDNLEHLLRVGPELSELLTACPELTLLATSRELLRLSGERPFDLPPLPEEEGVALFCERAGSEPSDTIRTLCTRLEGLPLAIELAAARMRLLSPEQLLDRLSQRLDLLKGVRDADPRQQTLRATIQWSYDLLPPDEQALFARLSVFAGGCTLEGAEEVADADLDSLESLLDKSLLRRLDSEAGPRFWMLETIREFAAERLEASGEEDSRRERHLAWYASLASELAEPVRKYSPQALAALEHELDNMRAALGVAVDLDEVVRASDLMTGLWFYWLSSGRGEEARAWADRYLASSRQSVSALERLDGDLAAAEILRFTGDPATAADLKREGVATGRANPNAVIHGVAIERSIAATLSDLAYIEVEAGRLDEARSCAAEALALRRELGLPHGIAHALIAVAAVEFNAGDFERAGELYAEAAVVSEGAGAHGDALEARLEQAECELLLGRLDGADALLRDGLAAARSLQDLSLEVLALRVAAMLAAAKGEAERSAILFGALDANLQEGGLTLFSPVEEELKRPYLDRVQRDLGDTRFRAAYERGMRERKSIEADEVFSAD